MEIPPVRDWKPHSKPSTKIYTRIISHRQHVLYGVNLLAKEYPHYAIKHALNSLKLDSQHYSTSKIFELQYGAVHLALRAGIPRSDPLLPS